MNFFDIVLLFSFIVVTLSSRGGYISPDGKVKIDWVVVGDDISFTISAQSPGWVGLSISNSGIMMDSDFILGYNTTEGPVVLDCFANPNANEGHGLPSQDVTLGGTDDLFDKKFESSDGILKMSFSRKLKTEDQYDLEIQERSMFLLYAFGSLSSSGVPQYHQSNRNSISVNLLSKLEFTSPDGKWSAKWNFNDNVDEINFRLRTTNQGWMGIGISTTGVMDDSDFIIGFINNEGKAVITDRFENPNASNGRGRPEFDVNLGGTDDLFDISGYKIDEQGTMVTYLNFSRKTNTNDKFDIPIEQKEIFLLYAYGPFNNDGDIAKHEVRGSVPMNFEDGVVIPLPYKIDFRYIHASFMMIAWVLLVVPSMMLSRYFKFIASKWFLYHWVLNVLAMILAYMALIIILIYLERVPREAHVYIGLITLSLLLVQATIGFISNKTWYEGKPPAIWPDKIHWWLGRLVITLALINIFLGMNILQEQSTPFIIFATWLGITIVFMIFLELKVGQKNEYQSINEPQDNPTVHFAFKIFIVYWIATAIFSALSINYTIR